MQLGRWVACSILETAPASAGGLGGPAASCRTHRIGAVLCAVRYCWGRVVRSGRGALSTWLAAWQGRECTGRFRRVLGVGGSTCIAFGGQGTGSTGVRCRTCTRREACSGLRGGRGGAGAEYSGAERCTPSYPGLEYRSVSCNKRWCWLGRAGGCAGGRGLDLREEMLAVAPCNTCSCTPAVCASYGIRWDADRGVTPLCHALVTWAVTQQGQAGQVPTCRRAC